MATVHLVKRDGSMYAERTADPEGEVEDVYAVEVDDDTLARWDDAEEIRREADEAYREAMAPVWAAAHEIDDLYERAEDEHYANLPPRDPNAPPPGPIRDLFPLVEPAAMTVFFPGATMGSGESVTIKGPTINLTAD